MALFLITSLPSQSVSVLQSDFFDNELDDSTEVVKHENFLRLLQHAISLDIRILPITWDPALEKLGADGATSSVHQSLLNSQMTFAYKRFRVEITDPHLTEQQFRNQQYDAMVNELTVFGVPAIRDHPNIIPCVGICFEISPTPDTFWPVLVFSRSTQGDLETFTANSQALDCGFLLKVCTEVAKGIEILHRCGKYLYLSLPERAKTTGVVHGDIKPGNILVSQDLEQSATSITLADFGFSRHAATDEHLIRLTRSEPWEAPEWRAHQDFTLRDAKRLDMYSFGLICMWLFCKDKTMDSWALPSTAVQTAFTDRRSAGFTELQYRKHSSDDLILDFANRLLNEDHSVTDEVRSRLSKVFHLSLRKDPENRSTSIQEIIELLNGEECKRQADLRPSRLTVLLTPRLRELESSQHLVRALPPQWHGNLQTEKLFFHLESCDFRLHKFFVGCLLKMAEKEGCYVCSRNAAFQLAVCYSVGFGANQDQDSAKMWVEKSGRTLADAVDTIQQARDSKEGAGLLATLAKLGYRHTHSSTYRRDGILPEAIDYYRRTILTRQNLFGPRNPSVRRLQGILIDLLRWNGQSSASLDCIQEMLKHVDDLPLPDQMELKSKLLRIYQDLGRYNEAETLTNELLENYTTGPENDHSEKLDIQQEHVEILLHRGNFEDATSLAEQNLKDCLKELGKLHTTTRGAFRTLAAAYHAAGHIVKAIEIEEELVEIQEGFVTEQKVNPKLVEDLSRLGVRYYLLDEQKSALRCYEKVGGLVNRDKEMVKHAIIAVNNSATRLIREGRFDTASRILSALLSESDSYTKRQTREAALIMGNLAHVYCEQGNWEAAEPLERDVIEIRKEILGLCHQHTVTAMGQLRSTVLALGRFDDAAEIGREEYSAVESRPGVSVSEKVAAAQTIGRALESACAYREAMPFLHLEIALITDHPSDDLPGALLAMVLMAICSLHVQEVENARDITADVLVQIGRGASIDPEIFFDHMLVLAEMFLNLQLKLESEQILALLSLVLKQLDPPAPSLKQRADALMSRHYEQAGNQNWEVAFNPLLLLSERGRG